MSETNARPSIAGSNIQPLSVLLDDLPYDEGETIVVTPARRLTIGELRRAVHARADLLRAADVRPGTPVGTIVDSGLTSMISMFAIWTVGAVHVPINSRLTPAEVTEFLVETPVGLVVCSPETAQRYDIPAGLAVIDPAGGGRILRPAAPIERPYDPDVAIVLRTSGTTGRPKAVLLRHTGTLAALDASLRKIRRHNNIRIDPSRPLRMNIVPASLALWAGIYNTVFSLRAGFGVVLLDKFTVPDFVAAVREFRIKSTVLAPAMVTMLTDDDRLHDLAPLDLVRSITAPLSPQVARSFYDKFGVFVLNSYGQTELGGEVAGWTNADVREFGVAKLGAVGRPYDDVDLRVVGPDGTVLGAGEYGEIQVDSPYRMHGYASSDSGAPDDDQRFADGYLRTGDIGCVDADGFVWIQGRVSDMINRGGLKVFPDEVEEVLRRHPLVHDACVCAVPDHRLGEVPHAWVIADGELDLEVLGTWCREHLVPYKIPAGFSRAVEFPRNEIGKVLRRDLARTIAAPIE